MGNEPAHRRLERIKRCIVMDNHVALEDIAFLCTRLAEAEAMLRAQQGAVSDAAERWHKIGYDEGYAKGYEDALA